MFGSETLGKEEVFEKLSPCSQDKKNWVYSDYDGKEDMSLFRGKF
jgi:hypothetical protein